MEYYTDITLFPVKHGLACKLALSLAISLTIHVPVYYISIPVYYISIPVYYDPLAEKMSL